MSWLPPADADRGRLECVFQRPQWHDHKGDFGRYTVLEWVPDGARRARIALRDVYVPGVYRRWALLGAPEWIGGGAGPKAPPGPPASSRHFGDNPSKTQDFLVGQPSEAGGTPAVPVASPDQAAALADLLATARRRGVDVVDCRFNMARWHPDAVPSEAQSEPFGTYTVDLATGLDPVIQGLSSGHRRDWRRGLRDGLTVRERVHPDDFIALLTQTYEHGGKKQPFSERYLRRLLEAPQIPTLQVGVYQGDQLTAAALVPYDRHRGYYLHGGVTRPAPIGAAVLAHMSVMERLIGKGVAAYDLGGVRPDAEDPRLAGIADFKRRFGGVFEPVARWQVVLTARGRLAERIRRSPSPSPPGGRPSTAAPPAAPAGSPPGRSSSRSR